MAVASCSAISIPKRLISGSCKSSARQFFADDIRKAARGNERGQIQRVYFRMGSSYLCFDHAHVGDVHAAEMEEIAALECDIDTRAVEAAELVFDAGAAQKTINQKLFNHPHPLQTPSHLSH